MLRRLRLWAEEDPEEGLLTLKPAEISRWSRSGSRCGPPPFRPLAHSNCADGVSHAERDARTELESYHRTSQSSHSIACLMNGLHSCRPEKSVPQSAAQARNSVKHR